MHGIGTSDPGAAANAAAPSTRRNPSLPPLSQGLRTAIFYTRLYSRSLRTGLAVIAPSAENSHLPVARSIRAAETALNTWFDQTTLAA